MIKKIYLGDWGEEIYSEVLDEVDPAFMEELKKKKVLSFDDYVIELL